MSQSKQKIVQYLNEAHATEVALIRVLQSQIAMTPRGRYRDGLEAHLAETRDHAKRVQRRLGELDVANNPVQVAVGVAEGVLGQVLAFAKTPLDMVRGVSGEEKVLKNAKDACATEALEIATYTALERLARSVGDRKTAQLAASIRADEQKMLDLVLGEIPKLADAVVQAEVEGDPSFDVTQTGAADAARKVKRTATKAASSGKSQAKGAAKGAVASEGDLPIAGYDKLTADEITAKLAELSQVDLATIDAYERKNQGRTTVLDRIGSLRGDEPWPSYDEQSVDEVKAALRDADDDTRRAALSYERAHKNRTGVISAAERAGATA
jgi:ferritin-like metal-binding protein YciE